MSKGNTSYSKAQFKKEFARLMATTSCPDNLPQEESTEILRELHDFVQPHIPAKLFRFRKCGIDEMISFEQGTISMCVADKFSDKYDSNVFYDYNTLTNSFENAFSTIMPSIIQSLRDAPNTFPDSPIKSKIQTLIKSSMSDDEMVKTLRIEYNNFFDNIKLTIRNQENWSRKNKLTKIACFTEKGNSKFMWDLYADGYKGFALEYDFRKLYMTETNLYPIIYSSLMLDATQVISRICILRYIDSIQTDQIYKEWFETFKTQVHQLNPIDLMYFTKMYLYKDKAEYSHEREWRMLKVDSDTIEQDFINIPDMGTLKAIYYGMHIEPRYKAHLRAIAKSKGIKEYDVVLDKNSRKYSLKVVSLE